MNVANSCGEPPDVVDDVTDHQRDPRGSAKADRRPGDVLVRVDGDSGHRRGCRVPHCVHCSGTSGQTPVVGLVMGHPALRIAGFRLSAEKLLSALTETHLLRGHTKPFTYRELVQWMSMAQLIKTFPHPRSAPPPSLRSPRGEREEKPFSLRDSFQHPLEGWKGGESKARGPKAGDVCRQ